MTAHYVHHAKARKGATRHLASTELQTAPLCHTEEVQMAQTGTTHWSCPQLLQQLLALPFPCALP